MFIYGFTVIDTGAACILPSAEDFQINFHPYKIIPWCPYRVYFMLRIKYKPEQSTAGGEN